MNKSNFYIRRISFPIWFIAATSLAVNQLGAHSPDMNFSGDVRRILSDFCFACHGPDEKQRQAGLRLDTRDGALVELKSGGPAIVPGNRDASEVWVRISSSNDELRMPPPETGTRIDETQLELIGRWIDQGAQWAGHWSYQKPVRPALPVASDMLWPQNGVDRFILVRLTREGLRPATGADRHTLARRASLDLIGLPPSIGQVDGFVRDSHPDAYERLIDRLLASPHYGEHRAGHWLDLARYADTEGHDQDSHREVWAYRDWVIGAFNEDMAFDRFTIEQLAGDLLPDATLDQRIATGFHRNTMVNRENGTVIEQYRVASVVDRINTTMTVWEGTTIGCAQCHSHKFDPFSQKEFYRLFAFFNNTEDEVVPGNRPFERQFVGPRISVPTPSEHSALVMVERNDPRATHLLIRGSYLNPGERVSAGVPNAWHAWPAGQPTNRLGLARWLMHPENPLTSRVAVNRIWSQIMGRPLVETSDDFGSQGSPPTHPRLLDFLADEFVRIGWSQKAMDRLLMTTATYRQSSRVNDEALAKDPAHRLYARATSPRLGAESIRDNALCISGLLDRTLGGPSVKLQRPPEYGLQDWKPTGGSAQFRRGLYAYIKRMVPDPTPTVLDAPLRDRCVVQRARTNTPLQALTVLNGPSFVACAAGLGRRLLADVDGDPHARAYHGFRLCLARHPMDDEVNALVHLYHRNLDYYRRNLVAAEQMCGHSLARIRPADADPAEWAAWTMVGNALLNLDETITRY